MDTKKCSKCNEVKSVSEFNRTKRMNDGYSSWCKSCNKEYRKIYNQRTKSKRKEYSKEYRSKVIPNQYQITTLCCTKCNELKPVSDFHKRKDSPSGYRSHCKQCTHESNNLRNKEYRSKQHIKDKRNQYMCERRKHSTFRLIENLRGRIHSALNGKTKSKSTLELLGCSVEYLKEHLQQTAINNGYSTFDINNYSGKEYHVDHIIPCAVFDLSIPDEQNKCFHYSNLQILDAKTNMSKSDKLLFEI